MSADAQPNRPGCNECKLTVTGGQVNLVAAVFDPVVPLVPDPYVALTATADVVVDFDVHFSLDLNFACSGDVPSPNITNPTYLKHHKQPKSGKAELKLPVGCIEPLCIGVDVLGNLVTAGLSFSLPIALDLVRFMSCAGGLDAGRT